MVLTDLVKLGDSFYAAGGTPASFGRGRTVRNFVGAPYQQMLDQGWYLYIAPTYDILTHKTATIQINAAHATLSTVPLAQLEIAAIEKQDALNVLIATDVDMTRTDEDMADSLLAAGISLLPEIPTKLANKKAARSAYLSL